MPNSCVAQKTFRYRLYPTSAQQRKMVQTLRECRYLYNHLLAERRDAYEHTGRSPSLYTQIDRLSGLKETNPALREVHSQVLQNVAVRIDLAFKTFFRRVKAGEKPGYPRFRGPNRYDSFKSGFRAKKPPALAVGVVTQKKSARSWVLSRAMCAQISCTVSHLYPTPQYLVLSL